MICRHLFRITGCQHLFNFLQFVTDTYCKFMNFALRMKCLYIHQYLAAYFSPLDEALPTPFKMNFNYVFLTSFYFSALFLNFFFGQITTIRRTLIAAYRLQLLCVFNYIHCRISPLGVYRYYRYYHGFTSILHYDFNNNYRDQYYYLIF